jgi:hypothetical protein
LKIYFQYTFYSQFPNAQAIRSGHSELIKEHHQTVNFVDPGMHLFCHYNPFREFIPIVRISESLQTELTPETAGGKKSARECAALPRANSLAEGTPRGNAPNLGLTIGSKREHTTEACRRFFKGIL